MPRARGSCQFHLPSRNVDQMDPRRTILGAPSIADSACVPPLVPSNTSTGRVAEVTILRNSRRFRHKIFKQVQAATFQRSGKGPSRRSNRHDPPRRRSGGPALRQFWLPPQNGVHRRPNSVSVFSRAPVAGARPIS